MDLSITSVPAWISILFVICFGTVPVFLIANTIKSASLKANIKIGLAISKRTIIFFWSYFVIIALISLTGFFTKNVLPPRIIILTALPLFLFYLFYIQKTEWFKLIFNHIKLEQLVFIHLFRFVGIFFFLAYAHDAIPKDFAFIGGIGDILTAILVFPVVFALKAKLSYSKKLVWVWNSIGLLDICAVLLTAIIITKNAIGNNQTGVQEFGTFPFSWIPAFAPATIIFLHILIFKKIKMMEAVS